MNPELLQALTTAALVAIPAILAFIVVTARPAVKAFTSQLENEVGTANWYRLQNYANLAVEAAEQMSGLDTNEKKKAFVVNFLSGQALLHGVLVTDEELDALIESTVYRVNHSWNLPLEPILQIGGEIDPSTVQLE